MVGGFQRRFQRPNVWGRGDDEWAILGGSGGVLVSGMEVVGLGLYVGAWGGEGVSQYLCRYSWLCEGWAAGCRLLVGCGLRSWGWARCGMCWLLKEGGNEGGASA